jgi:hypothetical protein
MSGSAGGRQKPALAILLGADALFTYRQALALS